MASIFEQSIYTIDISGRWGKEYIPMMDDILRFVAIQFMIQILMYSMDASMFPFFSPDFFLLLIFIVIGVMFYHLVFKRIIAFK